MVEKKVRFDTVPKTCTFFVNHISDGISLITKDEASGSSVTAEEAKKVLIDYSRSLDGLYSA